MSREETIKAILARADTLSLDYTQRFDELVNQMVPKTLANDEYAARCAALMIALNRELARCAATFGEVHEIESESMLMLVGMQFQKNYGICLDVLRGAAQGQTMQ